MATQGELARTLLGTDEESGTPETTFDTVHLSPAEWGNETMAKVAQEHFAAYPDCRFVEVWEHGGWYLGYRRDGSCWNTANDCAVLPKPQPQPSGGVRRTVRRREGAL